MRTKITQHILCAHSQLRPVLGRFARDERGATAIEYGLIAAMIALVCVTAFTAVGNANGGGWTGMAAKVNGNLH